MTVSTSYLGAVVREAGGPIALEQISLAEPTADQIVLKVTACGLCHSDVHFMHGTSGTAFPYLLGHEVAGTVLETGSGVTSVSVGDSVVVAPMVPCGECKHCQVGRTWACSAKLPRNAPATLADGLAAERVLGVGGLAERVVMPARQVVKIDSRVPAEIAALLGCGIPSGFGAAVNTAAVGPQDDVVVIGCGGVGIAAVAGAKHAGAQRIIAIDTNASKLPVAQRFGATDVIDVSAVDDVAAVVRELTDGNGADVVIDAVGGARSFAQALQLRAPGSRVVIVGAPRMGDVAELQLRDLFLKGGQIQVSIWGDCLASRDIPMLADLYLSGALPLQEYISETYALDEAQTGYDRLVSGEVLRSVVVL